MMAIDWHIAAVALSGLFLAGVVKGATGLGYSTCALPFLVPAVGLHAAMMVVLLPAIATNLGVALLAGHFVETLRRFYPFYLATLPGIVCGVLALTASDPVLATRGLGVAVLAYAVLALTKPDLALPGRIARMLQGPAGFANGVVTGLTGSQVIPLLPYMLSLRLDADRFVQAVNVSVLTSSVVLGAALMLAGTIEPSWLAASMVAVPPALLGVRLGNACRAAISPDRFRVVVLVVLLGMGIVLLVR